MQKRLLQRLANNRSMSLTAVIDSKTLLRSRRTERSSHRMTKPSGDVSLFDSARTLFFSAFSLLLATF